MNQKKAKKQRMITVLKYRAELKEWEKKRPMRWRFISYHCWKKKKPVPPNICTKAIEKVESVK